ncbi:MAG: 50S ribosomal protein L25/general stress protein Ctc [Pseudomonadales bacterium]
MSDSIVIEATVRTDLGKGASRRLRRIAGLMPAIIYGGTEDPVSISIPHKDILRQTTNEAFFASVLEIKVDGKVIPAIIKDLQRHPAKLALLHADFLRVDMKKDIHVHVPLHFTNEEACHGVKMQGGRIQHSMIEMEISCLPGILPEYLEVDMTDVELGQVLHISDVKLPEGVTSIALSHGEDHDLPIVTVVAPKVVSEDDEDAAAAAPAEDASEETSEE